MQIVRVTILVNLVMVISEIFTEFYTGGSHTASARYLYLGLHGHYGLVPWIWTALALNVTATLMFCWPGLMKNRRLLVGACVMAFVAMWIEKGMGLIVAGFIPSTLHEIVEYSPSLPEWKITAGIWAFGLMIYTVGIKLAAEVFKVQPEPGEA